MSREIDLIGGFYRDEPWSAQDTVNWLPVQAQAEGTRSPIKLRGAPGLKPLGGTVVESLRIVGDAPDGTVGASYSFSYSAAGGTPPYTFSLVSGTTPAGIPFSAGTISGTPTTVEVDNFRVRVTDSNGQANEKDDSIIVSAAPPTAVWFIKTDDGATAPTSTTYMRTTDPTNWSAAEIVINNPPGSFDAFRVSVAGGRVFFHDQTNNSLFTSSDNGLTFSRGNFSPTASGGVIRKIIRVGDRWLAPMGGVGISSSTDGLNFSLLTSVQAASLHYSNGIACLLMTGAFGYRLTRYSGDNGATWTNANNEIVTGFEQGWESGFLFGDDTRVMAAGFKTGSNNLLAYSDDGGVNWVLVTAPFGPSLRAIAGACGPTTFVLLANDGTIARSTNRGASWTIASGSLGAEGNDVSFANGVFVAVGAGRVIKTSTDGDVWTTRTPVAGTLQFTSVAAISA